MPVILGATVDPKPGYGYGVFFTGDENGVLTHLNGEDDWPAGQSNLVAGDFGAGFRTDLLMYRLGNDSALIYTTNGAGHATRLGQVRGWSRSLTMILAGRFGGTGRSDLLVYDPTARTGTVYKTDGRGGATLLHTNRSWRRSWSSIVPGRFSSSPPEGPSDLFFYDASSGTTRFYTVDGTGRVAPLGPPIGGQPLTWTTVVAGNFGGEPMTDLLCYEASTGRACVLTPDGTGGIVTGQSSPYFGERLTGIVAAPFTGTAFTDLFCYSVANNEATLYAFDGADFQWKNSWSPAGIPADSLLVAGDFGPRRACQDLLIYLR